MLLLIEGVNSDHNMLKIHVTCNVTCASRAFTNYLCTEQRFCWVSTSIVCVRVLVMPGRLAYASMDLVFTFHTSFQNTCDQSHSGRLTPYYTKYKMVVQSTKPFVVVSGPAWECGVHLRQNNVREQSPLALAISASSLRHCRSLI